MGPQESLELKISKFLRAGVIVAGIFLLIGWLSNFFHHGFSIQLLQVYHSVTLIDSINIIIANKDWGDLIAYIGMGILILLPITRVFLTAYLFLKQKEYLLAGIAAFVMIALLVSFSLGIEL